MEIKYRNDPLRSRLTAIRREIEELASQINALEEERAEIENALNVLKRYTGFGANKADAPQHADVAPLPHGVPGAPRPDNIPTIWEMTRSVLKDSPIGTLHVDDIVSQIALRWWPGLSKSQIGPSLYGFAKDGRLERKGTGMFKLCSNETEPPEGGSESREGDTSLKLSGQDRDGDLLSRYS